MRGREPNRMTCSFCGAVPSSRVRFIQGQGDIYICADCVLASYEMLNSHGQPTGAPRSRLPAVPKPHELVAALDRYVVGQPLAKKVLAVAAYNHYKRVTTQPMGSPIAKSNVLLIGPTGSGKTLLAQTMARILSVPFAVVDATPLTQAGYVGDDVENILLRLLQAADFDLAQAETGIIYIDELDKLARKSPNTSITRDVSGEGVQQALLKILEGTISNVPLTGGRKHPNQEVVQMNTRDILFICGGTFEGLAGVIAARQGQRRLGFQPASAEREPGAGDAAPTPEDLLQIGLIPELIGRLPVVVRLDPLSREDLARVLTEPEDSVVRQYQHLLALDGCDLEITPDALAAVAEEAYSAGTGARGLRAILERVLLDVMYQVPQRGEVGRCVIDAAAIRGEQPPTYVLIAPQATRKLATQAL